MKNRSIYGTTLLSFLTIVANAAPPSNDNRASATSLGSASSANSSGTLEEATIEPGEPDLSIFALFQDDPTVWYEWTAPTGAEWLRLNVSGVNLPTVITIYPGSGTTNAGLSRSNDPNYLVVPVVAGSTYKIRISSWIIDLYSIPPTETLDLDFELSLKSVGAATNAEDHILRGRGFLTLGSLAGLTAAETEFSAAVTLSPTNQEALFFRGFSRLLALEAEAEFSQLLTEMGITRTGSFREGGLIVPEDLDGNPAPATGANINQIRTWIISHLLPRLELIRGDFSSVTDDNFITQLGTNEVASPGATGSQYVLIDRGDVLAINAVTHGLEVFFNLIFTYDLGIPLQSAIDLSESGELSAQETMETFTSLLNFAADDRRSEFATSLTAMRDSYLLASTFINARSDQSLRLTEDLGNDSTKDAEIKDALNQTVASLSGPTSIQGVQVNLSQFMTTDQSLRDWLPQLEGNRALPGTLPDPTLDGILPNNTLGDADNLLYRLGALAGMAGYAAELGDLLSATGYSGAPFDDADGDGRANFDEWALLTDALTPDVVFQSYARQEIAPGQTELTLTFIRPKADSPTEWPLVVSVSDDLVVWDKSEAKVQVIGAVDNGDDYSETVTFQLTGVDPSEPMNRYFRIEAVRE